MSSENFDDPNALIGLAKLMRMAFAGADLTPLGASLIERSEQNPEDANALLDLSTALQLKGNHEIALAVQSQALQISQLYRMSAATPEPGIRLLAIVSPGDLMANTPVEFLVENSDVALDLLYLSPQLPIPDTLPDHDLVFIAVGHSDENLPLLQELETLEQIWPRPVLNSPERIEMLSRDEVSRQLGSTPGILIPVSKRVDRLTLGEVAEGSLSVDSLLEEGDFPIIARPVDSHAGRGLAKIDDAAALRAYLDVMPEAEFYVSRFIDYRNSDGQFRKYRIVLIEGRPYICHMAISDHWMIHYLNAGMSESETKRAEEARVFASFDRDFAERHQSAFRAICDRVGLDYFGIDCGETRDGRLLIFEVDSNMIVHALDPDDLFPYKAPQMRKVFGAFRQLLEHAVNQHPAVE